jgi:putative transposase
MVLRRTPFIVGEYYHIYNRGILKNPIFLDEVDKRRFIKLLFLCNSNKSVVFKLIQGRSLDEIDRGSTLVDIGVYCLMPNHFHFLVRERTEDGISIFMKKLLTAYAMYFNIKHERKGILFEGRFNAKHINTDAYLNWIFSYIHLNPIKLIDKNWKENGISNPMTAENFMQNYKYSSYYDYFLGDRIEKIILNKDAFPEHFSQLNDFNELIEEFNNIQGPSLDR